MRRCILIAAAMAFIGCGDDKAKNEPKGDGNERKIPGVNVNVSGKGVDINAGGTKVKVEP